MKTLIVNLFGGPGCGKSTGAAYIFSQLKMRGINCELVTEFAKDKVWEESVEVFKNQTYIFGKQYFKISRCANKVDVIVTDSPLLNSILYNSTEGETFNKYVKEVHDKFNNINFLIYRDKPYNSIGRLQTAIEAVEISKKCSKLLFDLNETYGYIPGTEIGYDSIVEIILNVIAEENDI